LREGYCNTTISLTTSAEATHGIEQLTSSMKACRVFAAGSQDGQPAYFFFPPHLRPPCPLCRRNPRFCLLLIFGDDGDE
jgi:hypothetical protein